MLVLIHLEWLNSPGVDAYPTQLAALRVDAHWNVINRFETLIFQPEEPTSWKHEAYGGIDAKQYHRAPDLYQAGESFRQWLQPEDVCCWWSPSTGSVLYDYLHFSWKNSHAIGERFIQIVMDRQANRGTPYRLAQQRGFLCQHPMHVAVNEVETVRRLLMKTRIDQALLLAKRLPDTEKLQAMRLKQLPYWYETSTSMVHSVRCKRCTPAEESRRSAGFDLTLRHHTPVCSCCQKEYHQAVLAYNAETMGEADCLYVYSPDSEVFHTADCRIARRICRSVLVAEASYKHCKATGRRRCQVCHPRKVKLPHPINQTRPAMTSFPRPVPPPVKEELSAVEKSTSVEDGHLTKDAQLALKRYRQARAESIPEKPLSPAEQADWRTLTQSTYAFFAAKGYSNFHMRDCPRLRGLTGIRGFSTFQQATACSLTPCRQCRPTAKKNLSVAIPVTSRVRATETSQVLDILCKKAKYAHTYEPPYYYITTPIGKWCFKTDERPIYLHHINLMRSTMEGEYHLQPRMFMSLQDTFEYIRRHDERLGKMGRAE